MFKKSQGARLQGAYQEFVKNNIRAGETVYPKICKPIDPDEFQTLTANAKEARVVIDAMNGFEAWFLK